jgi:hypothetical protein
MTGTTNIVVFATLEMEGELEKAEVEFFTVNCTCRVGVLDHLLVFGHTRDILYVGSERQKV